MATVSRENVKSWKTNSIDLMEEAAQLGILPPEETTLKFWGFLRLYTYGDKNLFILWKIYMLLIHRYGRDIKTLAEWVLNSKFADEAIFHLGSNTPEGVWLGANGPHVKPSHLGSWPTEPARIWYDHATQCLHSPDIKQILPVDPMLQDKQECYLVFGVFSFRGRPIPECRNPEIFGFDTCLDEQGTNNLYDAYFKAIRANSIRIFMGHETLLPWSPQFKIFWEQYHAGTIYPWARSYT